MDRMRETKALQSTQGGIIELYLLSLSFLSIAILAGTLCLSYFVPLSVNLILFRYLPNDADD